MGSRCLTSRLRSRQTGAGDRVRTGDHLLGRQILYRLSYASIAGASEGTRTPVYHRGMVVPEPLGYARVYINKLSKISPEAKRPAVSGGPSLVRCPCSSGQTKPAAGRSRGHRTSDDCCYCEHGHDRFFSVAARNPFSPRQQDSMPEVPPGVNGFFADAHRGRQPCLTSILVASALGFGSTFGTDTVSTPSLRDAVTPLAS